MNRVLILNSGKGPNKGDHAILGSQIENISDQIPDVAIKHLPVLPSKADFFSFFGSVSKSDLVIIGGGQMLRDDTSLLVIPLLSYRVIISKLFRKKVMFYGIGAGPISKKLSRFLVKYVIGRVDCITIRDVHSKELLEEIGIKKDKIVLTADPALSYHPAKEERTENILEEIGLKNQKIIAFTPRRAFYFRHRVLPLKYLGKLGLDNDGKNEQKTAEENIASACDYLIEKYGYKILFIAMTPSISVNNEGENDDVIAKRIISKSNHSNDMLLLDNKYSASEIKGILGKVDMLIAMRMHSTILACMQKTLISAIGINVKFYNFFERLGILNNIINVECLLDKEKFIKNIEDILKNAENSKGLMVSNLNKLLDDERKNVSCVKKLLLRD